MPVLSELSRNPHSSSQILLKPEVRAATELGISVKEVESLPFDLSTLESEDIFMNIDCRGFGRRHVPARPIRSLEYFESRNSSP